MQTAQTAAIERLLQDGQPRAALAAVRELRAAGTVPAWRVEELFAACFRLLGDAEGAAAALYHAAQADIYLRQQREHYSGYLFALHYLPGLTARALAQQHLTYGALYREQVTLPPRPLVPHDRLRIGYLAPQFCDSAAARFYAAMLTALPQKQFDLYLYALTARQDGFTAQMQQLGTYRDLAGQSLAVAAEAIRADEVDILVDLGGHTAGGVTLMVMAYRPVPVQLTALGWFDTTGLPAVDGLLTDAVLDPPAQTTPAFFTEHLCYLPQTSFCFTPTAAMQAARQKMLAEAYAPASAEGVVFGCLQNFLKINAAVLACWRQILAQLPTVRLVLQDVLPVPERAAALRERCLAAGLPAERLTVRPGRAEYLQDYAAIDVVLDTFPYPGGAMTTTALYLGRPVGTLAGDHHSARFGAAIVQAAGHAEWVAQDEAAYVALAVQLGRSQQAMRSARQALLRDLPQSPLMQQAAYGQHLAALYQRLWAAQLAPDSI